MIQKFSKFILFYLVTEAVLCVGKPQLLGLLNIPFKILNRLTCSLIEILDMIDQASYKTWMIGDVNQNAPETETEILAVADSFLSTMTATTAITSIANKFPLKIGQNNLIETFLGNFNRSLLINIFKNNIPALKQQARIFNENKLRLAPILKKYRSALVNAGSVLTKQTLGRIACYVRKYFDEMTSLMIESLYPLRDLMSAPYINFAIALGADPQCSWNDVPDVPDDLCFRSLDVLLIRGVSNLFRIKYLNFFSTHVDGATNISIISTEKYIDETETDIVETETGTDLTEKDIDVTDKDIDVTEKDIDVNDKDIDVTEKGKVVTKNDIDVTEKDIDVTEKDIDVTEKGKVVTKKHIDATEIDTDVTDDSIVEIVTPIVIVKSTKRPAHIHRKPLIQPKSSLIWRKHQQKPETDDMDDPRNWGSHKFSE